MEGHSGNTEAQISPEAQYQQAYESMRQHDRFIWQTPALVVVIDGTLIVSTFALVPIWWVREIVLACALVLTVVLTFALTKHRYFSGIEEEALTALEGHAEKHIQRWSTPTGSKGYWGNARQPNWWQKKSAYGFFIVGMCLINALVVALLCLNCPLVIP